jgi:hypothetical protein
MIRLQPGQFTEISEIWPQIDNKLTWEPEDDTSVYQGTYTVVGVLWPTESYVSVNISIVPEPSSLVLFGGGIGILNRLLAKRKQSAMFDERSRGKMKRQGNE